MFKRLLAYICARYDVTVDELDLAEYNVEMLDRAKMEADDALFKLREVQAVLKVRLAPLVHTEIPPYTSDIVTLAQRRQRTKAQRISRRI